MKTSNLVWTLCAFLFASCNQERYVQGKRIYGVYCESCHMEDGQGLGELYPSLSNSAYLSDKINELPCLIRNGRQSMALSTISMPANQDLTKAELLNVINYVTTSIGNQKAINPIELEIFLEDCVF